MQQEYVNQTCKIHNLEFIAMNLIQNESSENQFLCLECLNEQEEINKIVMFKQIEKKVNKMKQEINEAIKQKVNKKMNQINEFKQTLQNIQEIVNSEFNSIIKKLNKWLNNLKDQIPKNENMFQNIQKYYLNKLNESQQIQQTNQIIECFNKDFINEIDNILNKIDFKSKINELEIQLDYLKDKMAICVQQIPAGQYDYAYAFNNDGSIMISSTNDNVILLWQIEKQRIQPNPNQLLGHQATVDCFVFSNYQNWFVSGSADQSLICWKEQDSKWINSEQYFGHQGDIEQIILNKKEDQLISCDRYGQIIIWQVNQDQNTLIQQQLLENGHQQGTAVYGISLNDNEDYLVSCGKDNQIILWQKNETQQQWINLFSQQFETNWMRILFINNNEFIVQPAFIGCINIFKIINDQYEEICDQSIKLNDEIEDIDLFPPKYCKQRNLLMMKHNKFVYFLKRQLNGQFQIINTIDCICINNTGAINNDWNLFVNWNQEIKKLQVYEMNFQ